MNLFGCVLLIVSLSLLMASVAQVVNEEHKEKELRVHNTVKSRLETLQKFAKVERRHPCNKDKLLIVTEIPWGNSGNHIVSFTHMIYLAERMNATLIVPWWMTDILQPFNTSALNSYYCYTVNTVIPNGITPIEVTSEESYFSFILFHNPLFAPYLPPLNNETTAELSLHFLKVYAALWGYVLPDIREASEWLITNHLDGIPISCTDTMYMTEITN